MHRSDCKPHQPKNYWKPAEAGTKKHTDYLLKIAEFQGIAPGKGPFSVDAPLFYPVKYSQV